mgnify:CR=1 FL=1
MWSEGTIKPWHVVLLVIMVAIFIASEFWLSSLRKAAPKRKTDVELWQEYAHNNDCKIIERRDGYSEDVTGYGTTHRSGGFYFGSNYHPGQDLWLCADGVKHQKESRFAKQFKQN